MNPEVKEKWIAALLSGEYAQAQSALRSIRSTRKQDDFHPYPPGYCCLGVLCDLYVKETGDNRWEQNDFDSWMFDGIIGVPSEIVLNWANLKTPTGAYESYDGRTHHLTEKNDQGLTFPEIARIIEEYF